MKKLVLMLLTLILCLLAQDKYVQPTKDDTKVFENPNTNSVVITTVKKTERLQVVSEDNGYYRVKTESGKRGYVLKRNATLTEGKAYVFDGVQIEGYLDNPTPIYITDTDEGHNAPIDLDRSFIESLKNNVDKEQIVRINN